MIHPSCLQAIPFLNINKMINRKPSNVLAAGVGKFIQVLTLPQDVLRKIEDNMWSICCFKIRRRKNSWNTFFDQRHEYDRETDLRKKLRFTKECFFPHSYMKSAKGCSCHLRMFLLWLEWGVCMHIWKYPSPSVSCMCFCMSQTQSICMNLYLCRMHK